MPDHHDHHNTSDAEGERDIGTELLHGQPQQAARPAAPGPASQQGSTAERPLNAVPQQSGPEPPMRRSWAGPILAVVVCLLLGVLIVAGIHARAANERSLTRSTDAVAVPLVRVTLPLHASGQTAEVVLPANVTAFIDTPIYARTSGYLQHWYADIGTHVQKGALLAVIQTPELDEQVMQAQADLKTAQSNLQIAQTTATRWEKLLQKNAVSRQEADQTMSDLAARQSALSAQQANVKRLQQMQDFERIEAPFAGIITARNVDTGSLIEAGQNTTQKELFHLAATDRLRVFVPVPEVYQSAVHDGAKVAITLDAFPDAKFYGMLARNSRAVDPLSRTLNVEVDVDNTTGKLLPGAYAFVHLNLPPELRALRVPANALLFRGQGLQVGVVENDHVVLHAVKIGHDYGATVEITEGLKPSDHIVLDPSDSLESGDAVRVLADDPQSDPAAPAAASEKKGAQ